MHSPSVDPVPVIAVLVGLVIAGRSALRRGRRRRFLAFVDATIARHVRTLSAKRRHMVRDDGYGNRDETAWHEHVAYFVESVLLREAQAARLLAKRLRDAPPLQRMARRVTDAVDRHQAEAPGAVGKVGAVSGRDYEALCADILAKQGWNVSTTPASGDQGADLVAAIGGAKVVFQCKFHAKPVGNKAIQEAFAAMPFHGADYAAVVSNAPYTRAARELARANGVVLLHHEQLPDLAPAVAAWRAERA